MPSLWRHTRQIKEKEKEMKYNQIVKRLGELEYALTDGVSEYIEMLEEYIELYEELKAKEI
jgi:enterochelin esterase-like enzyme